MPMKKLTAFLESRLKRSRNLDCDAHRGDGKRFIIQADDKLKAFLELESAVRSGN
jgi:hypothetical protein